MAVTFTNPATTTAGVALAGENALTRTGQRKRFNANGESVLVEVFEGPAAMIEEYYQDLKPFEDVKAMDCETGSGKGELTIEYGSEYAATGAAAPDNPDAPPTPLVIPNTIPEWSIDWMQIPRPLAGHPYFQLQYFPGSGLNLADVIAEADHAIATGQEYAPSDAYKDYMKRYYGLRTAGVEEYPESVAIITKQYQTTELPIIEDAFTGIDQVVDFAADINPPLPVISAIDAKQKITSYGTSDPASFVFNNGGAVTGTDLFEWLKKPTRLVMSGNENAELVNITEMWWGVPEWSAVIYPRGSWDPVGRTT